MQFDMNNSMFQKRLQQIMQMPEGEAKQKALLALSRDYPGELEKLNRQRSVAEQLAGKSMPRGQVAGNNPYSVYVGRGGEALMTGIGQAAAYKQMGNIDAQKDVMSAAKQKATQDMMEAAMQQQAQASALREECPPGLTQQECEQRKRMMGGQRYF